MANCLKVMLLLPLDDCDPQTLARPQKRRNQLKVHCLWRKLQKPARSTEDGALPFLACKTERQFQIEEVRGLGTGTAGRLLAQADEVAGMEARVAYRQVQALTQRLAQAQVRPVTEEAPAAATRVAVAGRAGQEVVEAV